MVPLFGGQIPHFHDANGKLANGYRLHFYLNNSSTPVTVFKDIEGRVPYTNPIVLDNRGETETQVYVNPSLVYKMVLKDKKGAVVNSSDDITAEGVDDLPEYISFAVEGSVYVDVEASAQEGQTKFIVKLNENFKEDYLDKEQIEEKVRNSSGEFVFDKTASFDDVYNAKKNGKVLVYSHDTGVKMYVVNETIVNGTDYISFACVYGGKFYSTDVYLVEEEREISFGEASTYDIKEKQSTMDVRLSFVEDVIPEGTDEDNKLVNEEGIKGKVDEAPVDGNQYVRKNGKWSRVQGSGHGGGVEEAPYDGFMYARKNDDWEKVAKSVRNLVVDEDTFKMTPIGDGYVLLELSEGMDIASKEYVDEKVGDLGESVSGWVMDTSPADPIAGMITEWNDTYALVNEKIGLCMLQLNVFARIPADKDLHVIFEGLKYKPRGIVTERLGSELCLEIGTNGTIRFFDNVAGPSGSFLRHCVVYPYVR